MEIIFGGSFNPPTKAHYEIAKYLLNKFPDSTLVLLPNGDRYPRKSLVLSSDRIQMLNIMARLLGPRVTVSDFEVQSEKFRGTYYTLKNFKDPYFVIGLDSLSDLSMWIEYEKLVKENKFLVINRDDYHFDSLIENNALLKALKNHFILLDDFPIIRTSSTSFRKKKNFTLLIPEIKDYIIEHKLY